jgi:hypothetical protein
MTHKDTGHYAGKRRGMELNETIAARIKEKLSENRISCAEAHSIAVELNKDPAEVGTAIDLLEVRISGCQLGLFGHGKEKNIPVVSDKLNPEVESAVKASLIAGRLPCSVAWEISKRFSISKPMIAGVCEKMKIKIAPCQLGAFK